MRRWILAFSLAAGAVSVGRAGQSIPGSLGLRLQKGDLVTTGPTGRWVSR
jgi:hypothetical protein